MVKSYQVSLTDGERDTLRTLVRGGTARARTLTRAHILLLVDAGWTDHAITEALHINHSTVERTRQKYTTGGMDFALCERPRPGGNPKLDGRQEALLVALACTEPPVGRTCWTMQLLADRLVTLQVVDSISDETVRSVLKKMRPSPGREKSGVSRP